MGQFARFPNANFANITISDTEPVNPQNGDVWIDTSVIATDEETVLGCWRMNEASGTVVADCGDNAYHGTSVDTTIVDGLYPGSIKAQQGNGAGYIVMPAELTLAGLSNFKLEIYFRKDATTGDGVSQQIVNQYFNTSNASAGFYVIVNTTNNLKIICYIGGVYKAVDALPVFTVVVGTVYKLEVEYDGAKFKATVYEVNTTTGVLTLKAFGYSNATGTVGNGTVLKPITLLANNKDYTEKGYFTVDNLRITTKV